MRDLTKEEREAIKAKFPKAKVIAVDNFLMTLGANPDAYCAQANLRMDARMYRWSDETVAAIEAGIQFALENP